MAKHTSTCRICGREYQGFCKHGTGERLVVPGSVDRGVDVAVVSKPKPDLPSEAVPKVSPEDVPQTEVERMLARRAREAAYMRAYRAKKQSTTAKREAEGK